MGRRRVATIIVGVVATALTLVGVAPAEARSGSTTVRTTIDIPALVLVNSCNADVVSLSGDLRITTVTTPARDGGSTVRSSAVARNLRGSRIAPLPAIGYRGSDGENTVSYYAPPPRPATHEVAHWTTLIPQGPGPRMYLLLVIRETVAADGTVLPVFESAALTCRQPSTSANRV